MQPRDRAVLLDMVTASERILDFKLEMDRAEFLADLKTQSAILHQLMILGEAGKRVSLETRSLAPGIPWRLIAGMRDNLIHDYGGVDLIEVWKTAEKDIPILLEQLRSVLLALESQSSS